MEIIESLAWFGLGFAVAWIALEIIFSELRQRFLARASDNLFRSADSSQEDNVGQER